MISDSVSNHRWERVVIRTLLKIGKNEYVSPNFIQMTFLRTFSQNFKYKFLFHSGPQVNNPVNFLNS